MAVTEHDVEQCLRGVTDPNTGRDFVATKSVKKIRVDGNDVNVDVQLGYPAKSQHETLKRLLHDAIASIPGVSRVSINLTQKTTTHAVQRGVKLIPGVKNIVAVASGKGGWASRRPLRILRWPWPLKVQRLACSTPISTVRHNR